MRQMIIFNKEEQKKKKDSNFLKYWNLTDARQDMRARTSARERKGMESDKYVH